MTDLMIVDDHPIFLDGLRQYLTSHDYQVMDCARSVDEALDILETRQPEILILDVSMKDGGGLRVLSQVRKTHPVLPTVFLTVSISSQQIREAVELDINGIAFKDSDPEDLLQCLEHVARGEDWIDPSLRELVAHSERNGVSAQRGFEALTEREWEIAGLIKQGLRNRAIADMHSLSEGTVKAHVYSIFQKVGVKSRSELIVAMMQAGYD